MDDPDRSDEEFLLPKPVGIRKKRRRYDRFQKTYERTTVLPEEEETEQVDSSDDSSDDDDSVDDAPVDDGPILDDDELFAAPDHSYDSDQEYPINTNIDDLWILL